ncbi:MAG: hypothetical protein HW398_1107 [Acidobacteria bacterium]|nr:hypothetical protein [Acidobacteriota bacterium]
MVTIVSAILFPSGVPIMMPAITNAPTPSMKMSVEKALKASPGFTPARSTTRSGAASPTMAFGRESVTMTAMNQTKTASTLCEAGLRPGSVGAK